MAMGNNKLAKTKMKVDCWRYRLPYGCGVQGFTRFHWMPPSGECLRRIAPAAVMIDEFVETTLNTNKTQLLPSNYGTFRSLVVCENFVPQNGPSTQLMDATSCVKM